MRDRDKRNLCNSQGIKLIEIKYNEYHSKMSQSEKDIFLKLLIKKIQKIKA